jgi:Flp pilus assembly protein TadG
MKKFIPAGRRHEAGLALVEFALVVPILIMLLIGLIEYGRLAYFTIEVANAAHAGAQYASLSLSNAANTSGIQNAATKDGQNSIASLTVQSQRVCSCWSGTSETALTTAQCASSCPAGQRYVSYAQVTVNGSMSPLFNYSYLGLPGTWSVSRTATIRVTQR